MKKLKLALTLLLVCCCSLCMFACGGKDEAKSLSRIDFAGQKQNFKEGEEFSVGDLQVTAYYQGDDDPYVLAPEDYEVDSSAYNSKLAGEYLITVIPKNQPANLWDGKPESKDNRYKKSYYVTVDHSWTKDADGKETCKCGAERNLYTGLEDHIHTVGWGNPATLTRGAEGKTYPNIKAPIAGENHVAVDSLIRGQSLKLNLQITGLGRGDNVPNSAEAWDNPLMGLRNAGTGALPRGDGWIIGSAAGYMVPATSNIPSTGGTGLAGAATADSAEWNFYTDGTTMSSKIDYVTDTEPVSETSKWSTIDIEYIYQQDGIFMIRETLHKFDGSEKTLTFTVKVPDAAYEIVAYGEYVDYTITGAEFVAGRAIKEYEIKSDPTEKVQPQGKLFNAAGLNTKATFSDQGTLEGSYNAYAYHYVRTEVKEEVPDTESKEEGATKKVKNIYYDKTRVNLASDPLQPDFFGFYVEFNGMQAYLSTNGEKIEAADRVPEADFTPEFLKGLQDQDKIHVVETPISGANASAIEPPAELELPLVLEAPDVVYDYAVTNTEKFAESYIRLVATGKAVRATGNAAEMFGDGGTHYIAFKLVTTLSPDAVAGGLQVQGEKIQVQGFMMPVQVGTSQVATFDIIVLLEEGFDKTIDLTLNEEVEDAAPIKIQLDLNGIEALSDVGVEIVENKFTLDQGGTIKVKYSGLTGNLDELQLSTRSARDSVATVKAAVKKTYTEGTVPTKEEFYRATNSIFIVGLEKGTADITVTYWLAAPDLGNLTADSCTTSVELRDKDNKNLATARLEYRFAVSEQAIDIGSGEDHVYVLADGNKLQVFAFADTKDITNGKSFTATLNIENSTATSYNVGVSITNGAATWLDLNDITMNSASAAKLVALGTIGDATDYDKAYLLVANLHLPAIGLRDGSDNKAQVYHFTANEDADHPAETYTVYTVGGNEADPDAIGQEEKAVAGLTLRKDVVKFTCLQDGRNAYEYTYKDGDADKVFLFGAQTVKASGVHTWNPTEGDDRTCSVCGAHYMKFTDTDGTVRELTDLPTTKRVANPDLDKDDWWKNPTEDVPVTGDFVVRFSWTNIDANYPGDGAVEMYDADSNYFGYRTFVADYNPGPDTSKLCSGKDTVATTVYKKNGAVVTGGIHGDNAPAGVPAADWQGEAYVAVYRYGTTLVIDAHLTLADGETTYQVTTTLTNFTTKDLNLHINGNHYWCDNLMVGIGSATKTITANGVKTVVSTGDLGMNFGKADNSTAYTGNDPLWTMEGFKPGMKVEVVGTMTNQATQVWQCGLAYLESYLNFRPDNWINGTTENGDTGNHVTSNADLVVAKNCLGFHTLNDAGEWVQDDALNAAWFAVYEPYIKSGQTFTQTTIWDWTDNSKIVVTYYIQGMNDDQLVQFRQGYTVTADANKSLATSYTIGLGVDCAHYSVNSMTVSTPVNG